RLQSVEYEVGTIEERTMTTLKSKRPLTEGEKLEYEMLRAEILQNNSLADRALGGTLLFVTALIGFALSQGVTNPWAKAVLFLIGQIIAINGLQQSYSIELRTYQIATYIRTFLERDIDSP